MYREQYMENMHADVWVEKVTYMHVSFWWLYKYF